MVGRLLIEGKDKALIKKKKRTGWQVAKKKGKLQGFVLRWGRDFFPDRGW